MKLLMMRPTYTPEISGGTHLAYDLVEDFIAAGWEVEVITPISEKYIDQVDENKDNCKVHRIVSKYKKSNVINRVLRFIDISLKMKKEAKKIKDADIIMTHSMPPLLGKIGARLAKKKKVPSLYWEQDIVSNSIISTGIMGKAGFKQKLAFKVAKNLEVKAERKSTHIVTISEEFKKMHLNRGINDEKVDVVYNWIDTNQVYPVEKCDNPLYERLGIPTDKFIVSYCGNLGVPQNVEIMIDAAEMLQDNKDILFVIIGGGSREKKVREYVQSKGLSNLLFLPLQPLDEAHLVYSVGDVGLVIGKRGTSKNGFPSKTWSIMSAAQAMIACFDEESELCSFVKEGNCGLAISPDDPDALASAITTMYENQEATKQMGKNAREYVESNFNRTQATKKIIDIAKKLAEENK